MKVILPEIVSKLGFSKTQKVLDVAGGNLGTGELGNWSHRTTSRNIIVDRDSLVSVATRYGLDSPETEYR